MQPRVQAPAVEPAPEQDNVLALINDIERFTAALQARPYAVSRKAVIASILIPLTAVAVYSVVLAIMITQAKRNDALAKEAIDRKESPEGPLRTAFALYFSSMGFGLIGGIALLTCIGGHLAVIKSTVEKNLSPEETRVISENLNARAIRVLTSLEDEKRNHPDQVIVLPMTSDSLKKFKDEVAFFRVTHDRSSLIKLCKNLEISLRTLHAGLNDSPYRHLFFSPAVEVQAIPAPRRDAIPANSEAESMELGLIRNVV